VQGATGRVVLTVLHNFLTPFVRYEIGDLVTPGPGRCPCGCGLPLLTAVLGKRRPLFRPADGGWKHSSGLVHAQSGVGGNHQHQAVQKAIDHMVIRIVPNKDWTADHAQRVRAAVREFLGAPVRVDVEVRERFELPRGGKLQQASPRVGAPDFEVQSCCGSRDSDFEFHARAPLPPRALLVAKQLLHEQVQVALRDRQVSRRTSA
jgi:phenylacetate-coenzyme A ligase PaaK-like adenylate-forming protein